MTLKARLGKLERRLPEPTPARAAMTLEETWEHITATFAEAEANPDDKDLQHKAALIKDILDTARRRRAEMTHLIGADPEADHDDLQAAGVGVIIESYSNPDDADLERRRRGLIRIFDQAGFRYWDTPQWVEFKATPAGVAYNERRLAFLGGTR